ncbi:MAG TPA: helix-turn-helix transcriptional regulator, partial [Streptosporangiaceae bacterium]
MSFAEQLRSLMGERGLRAADLARLVPCDKAYISRLVNGRQRPSRQIARRLDELVGAHGGLVAAVADGAAVPSVLPDLADPAGNWGRLVAATRQPSAVSAGVVEELEQITARQRVLYHDLSSAELLGPAEAHLRLLAALLRGMQPDYLRHRIASAAVETAGLAAWLWFDAGDRVKTAALYRMADDLLEEAGNPALGAYVTGYRALTADAFGSGREAGHHAEAAWKLAP